MPSNSTNKCPECKHEVLVHGSDSSTHTHCGDSLGYELICSCRTCKGTGIAPEPAPIPSSERDEQTFIDALTAYGTGCMAFYMDFKTNDELEALKQSAFDAHNHHTQIAQVRYALEQLQGLYHWDDDLYVAVSAAIKVQQSALSKLIGEKDARD